MTEISLLQTLQNRAARIVTDSRFDCPGLPFIERLGWQTIVELITSESNIMVFRSLHDLAPKYMCNLFTKASQQSSRNLSNTAADLRLPKKNSENSQKYFDLEVLGPRMVPLLRESYHPP